MKQVDDLTAKLEEQIAQMYYEHSWRKRPETEAPENVGETRQMESARIGQNVSSQMTQEAPRR